MTFMLPHPENPDELHHPGECVMCDKYPGMQRHRLKEGIAFASALTQYDSFRDIYRWSALRMAMPPRRPYYFIDNLI